MIATGTEGSATIGTGELPTGDATTREATTGTETPEATTGTETTEATIGMETEGGASTVAVATEGTDTGPGSTGTETEGEWCGNGIVEGDEDCDDEGESEQCDASCTTVDCGDGEVNASAGELCDDGGESASCDVDCTPWACGDGTVNAAAGEECDGAGESLDCDADCSDVECGDAHVNAMADEACDGAELGTGTCQGFGFVAGVLACTSACAYDLGGCVNPPGEPTLTLGLSQVKQFDFAWVAVPGADYYQLEESAAPGEPFVQLGADVFGESSSFTIPLCFRHQASYRLQACNIAGCTSSSPVDVVGSLAEAVGYFKASNTGSSDYFGFSLALAADGNTLAVGAFLEDSVASGIGGDQANDLATDSGAVYVFVRVAPGTWVQQAYIKASNSGTNDEFGRSLSVSADGSTLAVGAVYEDSGATGIDGDQADNGAGNAGAVYVFVRDGMGAWSQQAYVKASNTSATDFFGRNVALSGDGNTLAVGAHGEDGSATGVGNPVDELATDSGAVYVFTRDGLGAWSQEAYVKASNTAMGDFFGQSVALSHDGDTLAVGANGEDGGAAGIGGNQADDTVLQAGAVYVFSRAGVGAWSQQAYVKASNPGPGDAFGWDVALSADGDTLAVGAYLEDSNATGIDGDQANDGAGASGAVYVLVRDDGGAWSQQAYVKGSNSSANDNFGWTLALSGSGDALAVGAYLEDSPAIGVEGDQLLFGAGNSGAAYVLVRDPAGAWSQQAYVKASNTQASSHFGASVALNEDGGTLAVGAYYEDSSATGIGGDQANNGAFNSGAVYLY